MTKRVEIQIKDNRGRTQTMVAEMPTKKEIKLMNQQAREIVKMFETMFDNAG